ncbi:MAG: hypothetical protein J1E01_11770 [Acetatifactor sp.]|nr:hypothetical protein [Acetatifactor sp.]
MKKRIFATVMALLLSAAMLAGCGDSSKEVDRSSRNKRERSYEKDDEEDDSDDGGWLSNWIDSDSSEDEDSMGNAQASSENNDGASHPTDEDDPYFVGDDNEPNDEDITTSSGPTSPSDNGIPTGGNNVPSSGSNDAADSSAPSTGSSTSADDYLNDLREFSKFGETTELEDDDPFAMIAAMQSLVSNLQVKTTEGLAIKADLQDMIDLLNDLMSHMENWTEDNFDAALNRIEEISEAAEAHMKAFESAALAAGVDMDSLDELDDIFGL